MKFFIHKKTSFLKNAKLPTPSRSGISAARSPQMKSKFDIKEHNNILDEINAVINGGEVAEVKIEYKEGVPSLKVVRISRKVVASSR